MRWLKNFETTKVNYKNLMNFVLKTMPFYKFWCANFEFVKRFYLLPTNSKIWIFKFKTDQLIKTSWNNKRKSKNLMNFMWKVMASYKIRCATSESAKRFYLRPTISKIWIFKFKTDQLTKKSRDNARKINNLINIFL